MIGPVTSQDDKNGKYKPPVQAGRASRGHGEAQRLRIHFGAGARPGAWTGPHTRSVCVARSGHARLDERRPLLYSSRRTWRGDACRHCRESRCLEQPCFCSGRLRGRMGRGAGLRRLGGQGHHQGRSARSAAAGVPRHAGHARHDRVFRAARSGQAEGRRHRGGLGSCWCGGHGRRPGGKDQGMPCGGHCRRTRQVPLDYRRARFRRGHRLQVQGREQGAARALSQGHRRVF